MYIYNIYIYMYITNTYWESSLSRQWNMENGSAKFWIPCILKMWHNPNGDSVTAWRSIPIDILCTNDPCFDWKRPSFGGLKPAKYWTNRFHVYIYIYLHTHIYTRIEWEIGSGESGVSFLAITWITSNIFLRGIFHSFTYIYTYMFMYACIDWRLAKY